MKRRSLWSLIGFAAVLIAHAMYFIVQSEKIAEQWAGVNDPSYASRYFANGEYLIGASYALAAGFSIYALVRFTENQRKGVGGLLGGITLTGVLYVGGCFLLGCCGSPMLAVYLTLFGSSFLGFTKVLTLVLTSLSVLAGMIWLERRSKTDAACCEGGNQCKQIQH